MDDPRVRKVKCDEAFPVCHRCASTGRSCDGYGIWGGGGNLYEQRRPQHSTTKAAVLPRPAPAISPLVWNKYEKALFEWYRCRTALKLPGAFWSDFWTTLLPQASLSEPAILHAILALSSTHWDGSIQYGNRQRRAGAAPDKLEKFALQHYNQAIQHLRATFAPQGLASLRVALITCLVFVTTDLLRGHFATAQFHLRSGLKLLGDWRLLQEDSSNPSSTSTDKWVAEVFSRLRVQVELFSPSYQYPCDLFATARLFPKTTRFANFKAAWVGLQPLMDGILALTQHARELAAKSVPSHRITELLGHQQRLQAGLARWSSMYEPSKQALQGHRSASEGHDSRDRRAATHTLRMHHIMATIMADVCLRPDDEMAYDSHTDQFLRLVKQLIEAWPANFHPGPLWSPPGRLANMSRSIVDMGIIPTLYYTALKCRVPRIRYHALQFLESSFHREGIWDSEIVSRVARKVIKVEECGVHDNMEGANNFEITDAPRSQDLSVPPLPESHRVKQLEVVLSGSPLEEVILYCRQRGKDVDGKECIGKYNVSLQRWADEE